MIKQHGESVDPTQDSHEEHCNDVCPVSKNVLRVRALPRPGLLRVFPPSTLCCFILKTVVKLTSSTLIFHKSK